MPLRFVSRNVLSAGAAFSGRLRALADPAYPRKRDAQLAAFASLLERFASSDGKRFLILARGNRQNARPVAGPLPWRQHAESENLEHPPPVADRRHVGGTQRYDARPRSVARRSPARPRVASFTYANAAARVPPRPVDDAVRQAWPRPALRGH